MKAAAFSEYGGPDVLRWQDVDDPVPGPDDVLIEVHACSVNRVELACREGIGPWDFKLPHVLGDDFAGVIAELGSNVTGWTVGQPVAVEAQYACGTCAECRRWRPDLCPNFTTIGVDTWGGYGELVRVPARQLIALDSLEQAPLAASAFSIVSTAWHMVTKLAAIRPGETVLVPSASGGVAGSMVQCARLAGARVIASVGSADKADQVRAFGADEVFVYADTLPSQAVAEFTGGAGVDAVLDTIGGPLLADHLDCLRPDGRLAICGATAGTTAEFDLIDFFVRGLRILGFRIATPDDLRTGLRLVLDGAVKVPIARTFPLSQAAEAHALMARREHVGKIMLARE